MPRMSRSDTRKELGRLLAGLDLYRDWRIAMWKEAHGPEAVFDPNEFVETGAATLAQFDAYNGPYYAQFLKDIQAWYAHTAGELTYLLKNGDDPVRSRVQGFLDDFETRVGFAFFTEAGLLKNTVTKVLKRGHIQGEDEFNLLKDLLGDTDQAIVSPDEYSRLSQISLQFETAR